MWSTRALLLTLAIAGTTARARADRLVPRGTAGALAAHVCGQPAAPCLASVDDHGRATVLRYAGGTGLALDAVASLPAGALLAGHAGSDGRHTLFVSRVDAGGKPVASAGFRLLTPGAARLLALAAAADEGWIAGGSIADGRGGVIVFSDDRGKPRLAVTMVGPVSHLLALPNGAVLAAGERSGSSPKLWVARVSVTGKVQWGRELDGDRLVNFGRLQGWPVLFTARRDDAVVQLLDERGNGRLACAIAHGPRALELTAVLEHPTRGHVVAGHSGQAPWVAHLDEGCVLLSHTLLAPDRPQRVVALTPAGTGWALLGQQDDAGTPTLGQGGWWLPEPHLFRLLLDAALTPSTPVKVQGAAVRAETIERPLTRARLPARPQKLVVVPFSLQLLD